MKEETKVSTTTVKGEAEDTIGDNADEQGKVAATVKAEGEGVVKTRSGSAKENEAEFGKSPL